MYILYQYQQVTTLHGFTIYAAGTGLGTWYSIYRVPQRIYLYLPRCMYTRAPRQKKQNVAAQLCDDEVFFTACDHLGPTDRRSPRPNFPEHWL